MTGKCKITINNDILWADKGQNLGEVLKSFGYDFSMPCGGKGICKKCKLIVDDKEVLACKYLVISDINVVIPRDDDIVTNDNFEGNYKVEKAYLAIDIGSTTIAFALVDSTTKKIVRKKSFVNPQKVFGSDVMSRIEYCIKNGIGDLKKVLIDAIDKNISEFVDKNTFLEHIYVSGNTTMLHTFTGEDCSGMGFAPYTPTFLESKTFCAKDKGIDTDCLVTTLPNISSFVGSDITAGLLTLSNPQQGKYNLFIDMGTNAEVVLFDKREYLVTATSAGPCFEGAGISCGMTAREGAITHFVYPNKIKFIGKEAKGICGTGLIDIIAELYKNGIIDYTGYMQEDFCISKDIVLKREDIRQFQLAKSAIRSGVALLMEEKGISLDDIDTLYLAGGFSDFIDIDNAVASGLIDKAFSQKCKCVGNASLKGCVIYPFNKEKAEYIIKNSRYLDLTQCQSFGDKFMNYIFLNK